MKKILLMVLLIFVSFSSHFGKCDENNSISLVKKGERDWIKNYDNLFKKYKKNNNVSVSTLRIFFYDQKVAKECISFKDLQELNKKLKVVFASIKSDNDVNNFMIGVKSTADRNPPNASATKEVKKQVEIDEIDSSKDSIVKPPKTTNAENDSINILNQENAQLVKDKEKLEDDSNLWFRISIGLFTLLIGSIFYLYWYFSKKIEQIEKSSQNILKEQSQDFNRTIKELEVKNRENKNTFREAVPPVETKVEVIESAKEDLKKGVIPDPPKAPEIQKQFYLSTPVVSSDGQGFFDGSEVYNSANAISSLYEFVLDNDKRSADFKFLNTPNNVHDSLKFPDRYIQPACEYSGLNSKATKIITTKAGRAMKDGTNWKIIKKAEIRFE